MRQTYFNITVSLMQTIIIELCFEKKCFFFKTKVFSVNKSVYDSSPFITE